MSFVVHDLLTDLVPHVAPQAPPMSSGHHERRRATGPAVVVLHLITSIASMCSIIGARAGCAEDEPLGLHPVPDLLDTMSAGESDEAEREEHPDDATDLVVVGHDYLLLRLIKQEVV